MFQLHMIHILCVWKDLYGGGYILALPGAIAVFLICTTKMMKNAGEKLNQKPNTSVSHYLN